MGRILIFDYTFDASAQTVTLDGIWQEKQILMVNNATRSKIIYSPFDPTRGLSTSFTHDYETNKTTMSLSWDTTSYACLLYTSPSPRDATLSRMPSSA